jgi:hypothetical protein
MDSVKIVESCVAVHDGNIAMSGARKIDQAYKSPATNSMIEPVAR